MGENQKSNTLIENLATVTDAMQTIFPEGKIVCIYELNTTEFESVQKNFRKIDNQHTKFSIDISGLEHLFILENTSLVEEVKVKTIKQKLLSWFKSGRSSVK